MTDIDYTEIRNDRIRTKICQLMSVMLDNPDEHGIYPTGKFMWEMETFILAEIHKPTVLLKLAKCAACDGSGAYHDGHGNAVQCQWCDEREQLLKETEAGATAKDASVEV